MELVTGVEPATYGLQNRCSAIELHQPVGEQCFARVVSLPNNVRLATYGAGAGVLGTANGAGGPMARERRFGRAWRERSKVLRERALSPQSK